MPPTDEASRQAATTDLPFGHAGTSPSTENKDRKLKLLSYRAIPSVQEIVLIDQQQLDCKVHRRLDDGRWLTELLLQPESRLRLANIGFDQPLSAIYANVSFEKAV